MPVPRTYRVADVARLSGVSIRALHHYDAIGLLVPTGRTEAGYRLYTDADLLRLQQILIRRELGFPLEAIKRSLDDRAFDYRRALLEQRRLLQSKAQSLGTMLRAVDAALAVAGRDPKGRTMDMKELFGRFDPAVYETEVKERWGSDAYEQTSRRVNGYTAEDWKRQQAEIGAIHADAATLMRQGADPSSPAALAVAERHRQSIDRWFYPCSSATHAGLADMYESDARFAAAIDAHAEGLTRFLSAAIRANAAGNA
jgi:DNA-binding transcriptional MerR regulator